jgi:hypothetical protein
MWRPGLGGEGKVAETGDTARFRKGLFEAKLRFRPGDGRLSKVKSRNVSNHWTRLGRFQHDMGTAQREATDKVAIQPSQMHPELWKKLLSVPSGGG